MTEQRERRRTREQNRWVEAESLPSAQKPHKCLSRGFDVRVCVRVCVCARARVCVCVREERRRISLWKVVRAKIRSLPEFARRGVEISPTGSRRVCMC